MYLKSLTLRGFKSFASSTTLDMEPGITCVVGPNGSGKSNVVDALSWVLGEQGAKSLRGGKMEDVIFAGTTGRAPLGRAEVILTIDNSDGALPIEYAEVTISRTMFRNGGSEYAINGQVCRLLDLQELLSDSGIGKEMHVIVGQGQLDAILHASPEDRRGFVEEAAGVLKHRKRKEKALRKLDATDGNLTRLSDLLTEVRRQLKPLGRQAEVARTASVVQADLRDARARLLADDVVSMQKTFDQELADEAVVREHRMAVERDLLAARATESELDTALRSAAPRLAKAQQTYYDLSTLRERFKATASLAGERLRNIADEPVEERHGRDPGELEAEAARVQQQEAKIAEETAALGSALEEAIADRHRTEDAHAAEDRRVSGLLQAAADRREGLARMAGRVHAMQSRVAATDEELHRLEEAHRAAVGRAEHARRDFTALEIRIAGFETGEHGLDAAFEAAQAELTDVESRITKVHDQLHRAEQERAALHARAEALELTLAKDGAGALLDASAHVSGLLGSVAALVSIRAGKERAIAAALGSFANAVAVDDLGNAVDAIGHLKQHDLGRVGLVLASAQIDDSSWPVLPIGAAYATTYVDAPAALVGPLRRLLFKAAVVDDLGAARALVQDHPDVVAVTVDGDVVGAYQAAGGSTSEPSMLEIQAAFEAARAALDDATSAQQRARFELGALESEQQQAAAAVEVALAKLHESDASMSAVVEELAQLGGLARAAAAEGHRLEEAIAEADAARGRDQSTLAQLEERMRVAEQAPGEDPDTSERECAAAAARAARQTEMDGRLALRTAEERIRALRGRADDLLRAAGEERSAQARAESRRRRRTDEAAAAHAVVSATAIVISRLDQSVHAAVDARRTLEAEQARRGAELADNRQRVRSLEVELSALTDSVHRDDVLRAEHRLRRERLEERSLDELGLSLETLVAEFGPDRPIPAPSDAATPDGEAVLIPYIRPEQEKRLRAAERALSMLGRVNPLALEEFAALEGRNKFLTEQFEDLKKTRRDLLDIIKEVDGRVEQVFMDAYRDVEREFADVFSRLFPGGAGRLVLTDPDDILATGVDVEARPAGKKLKRLSLLSGGERSLVAVAFLVALFKARPSPFYILDEVEATLDDTNLGRLLEIYEELRITSQLLVITHQKRTMEVADTLYGVSMRGDGVSTVVSQRLREAS